MEVGTFVIIMNVLFIVFLNLCYSCVLFLVYQSEIFIKDHVVDLLKAAKQYQIINL